MKAVHYSVAYLVPLSALAGLWAGGLWTLAPVLFVFVLVPFVDESVGDDEVNPTAQQEADRAADPWFRRVVRGWVPLQLTVLIAALITVAGGGLSAVELVGLILAVGVTGGVGINAAHELMHRRPAMDRALAEVLMTAVSYPHFCVEHVHGHHKRVATEEDPATARLGETVYGFVPRSILGGVSSFAAIEARLAGKRGATGTLHDRRVRYALNLVVAGALASWIGGALGLLLFAAQSVVAIVMLEVINYIEHYGLQRKRDANGRYERTQPEHSWNSAHAITGRLLFGLPRHSDHHFLASREYPILRHHAHAPQLPAGYATMFLIALAPPLWRRVMDERVERLRAIDPPRDMAYAATDGAS